MTHSTSANVRPSAVCNDIPDGKCGQVDVGGPFMGIPNFLFSDACCCKGDFCNGPFAPQDLRTSIPNAETTFAPQTTAQRKQETTQMTTQVI